MAFGPTIKREKNVMQYEVTLVEQMTVRLTVEAASVAEALWLADRQFLLRDVNSIEWQRLDTRLATEVSGRVWETAVLPTLEPAI
jgi:hypothetical protein